MALSADYQRLEFLRVLRSHDLEPITDPGALIAQPPVPPPPPVAVTGDEPVDGAATATGTGDAIGGSPDGEAGDG